MNKEEKAGIASLAKRAVQAVETAIMNFPTPITVGDNPFVKNVNVRRGPIDIHYLVDFTLREGLSEKVIARLKQKLTEAAPPGQRYDGILSQEGILSYCVVLESQGQSEVRRGRGSITFKDNNIGVISF